MCHMKHLDLQPSFKATLEMKKAARILADLTHKINFEAPMTLEKSPFKNSIDISETPDINFISRPPTMENLLRQLKNALLSREVELVKSSAIFVRVNAHFERVDLKDIIHIQGMSDYVTIHTSGKKYTILSTLKKIENKIPQQDFIRVHKSFIVRIDCISEIEKDTITVEKNIIPIGFSYRNQFRKRLNII